MPASVGICRHLSGAETQVPNATGRAALACRPCALYRAYRRSRRLTGRLVAPGNPASRRYIWRCILPTLSRHHPSAPCSLHEPTAACLYRLRHPSPALPRSRSPCRPPPRLPPPRSSLSRWAARHPLLSPSPPSLPMPLHHRLASSRSLCSAAPLSSSLSTVLSLHSSRSAACAQQLTLSSSSGFDRRTRHTVASAPVTCLRHSSNGRPN